MIIVGLSKNIDRDVLFTKTLNAYCNVQSIAYEPYALKKDADGKPYIEGNSIKVSISHSGEYLAIALSNNDVGIDIQEHVEADYLRIAKRYDFSAESLLDFYKKYTLAECEVKRTNGTLPNFLRLANQLNGIHYDGIKGYTLSITPIDEYTIIEF
ncbi:MAG: hypothetical protein IJ033_06175 [Clostridia bacterium]|nr:hypothetical protein [Clostridia bacterium]